MTLAPLNDAGTCPDCGGEQFIIGPSGGNALNIKCADCGSKFWYSPPFPPERIDNDDCFYTSAAVPLREVLQ
jgi:hypothetical protein